MEITEDERIIWNIQRVEAGPKAGLRVYCSPACVHNKTDNLCQGCLRLTQEYAELLGPGSTLALVTHDQGRPGYA